MENREARRVKIGYLPFYVDYYEGTCPDFPVEKAAVARRCAERLSDFGQVVWDGKLIRDVDSAAETGGALKEKRPDCVVVLTTIAVFGGIPWAALRPLRLPILIWNAQGIERVGEGYSMVEIVRNTGQIGAQALANTLLREGRSFRVVTGYERSEETRCQLESYFRVIRTVKAIRRAKLLAIGETFPLMTDISVDVGELERRIGPTVLRVTNEELTQRYLEMDEGEVDEGRRRMRDEFAVEDLSEDEAGRSVRLSLCLRLVRRFLPGARRYSQLPRRSLSAQSGDRDYRLLCAGPAECTRSSLHLHGRSADGYRHAPPESSHRSGHVHRSTGDG